MSDAPIDAPIDGDAQVAALIARSNRLGSDPTVTNYAGGNTSAKGRDVDPVTGSAVELLWVKGSGGDLGTLTEKGLAVLRLDRLQSMVGVYRGVEHEDEMVAAFDFCLHGRGGAAPSIDTAMHGLVGARHVDHLHPDAGIAFATAADGEALTRRCFGDRVGWIPWRRPGFQLGLEIAEAYRAHPEAIGVVLGGHGITAWGATSDECEARSLEIIRAAQAFIDANGIPEPFGAPRAGFGALPQRSGIVAQLRWRRLCVALPPPTIARSVTSMTPTRCSTSSPVRSVPSLPSSARRAPTTSCARRCGRCWSTSQATRASTMSSPA